MDIKNPDAFYYIVANIKPLMTTGKGKNQRVITGSAETNGYATFVMGASKEVWTAHPTERRRDPQFFVKVIHGRILREDILTEAGINMGFKATRKNNLVAFILEK